MGVGGGLQELMGWVGGLQELMGWRGVQELMGWGGWGTAGVNRGGGG